MRQAEDDLLPVAEAEDAGVHEISGAGEEIVGREQPEKVAKEGAGSGGVGDEQSEDAGGQIDERAASLDPAVFVEAGEVIAGQLDGDASAEPRGHAVT